MRKEYMQSVHNAIYAQRRVGFGMPLSMKTVLERLYDIVPNHREVTPMCVTHASLSNDFSGMKYTLSARMVVQLGWDLQMALLMWRNFRFNFPGDPYAFDAKRLFTEQQLVDQYGKTFGMMLSNLIQYPETQPVLNALFHGDVSGTRHALFYTVLVVDCSPVMMDIKDHAAAAKCAIVDLDFKWVDSNCVGYATRPEPIRYSFISKAFSDAIQPLSTELPETFSADPKFVDYSEEASRAENR